MSLSSLSLAAYDYSLPDERIAKYPLDQRDQARLLVYRQGEIHDQHFYNLPDWLPKQSCLCFNNTKVIPARLHFRKPSSEQGPGALIEILLLHPLAPSTVMSQVMSTTQTATWECMIGNLRKWKPGLELQQELWIAGQKITLWANLLNDTRKHVQFSWDTEATFAEIVEAAGKVPLPPYLHRESTEEDRHRYQTVYSKAQGAVAAPTAGLHFTDAVLDQLKQKDIAFNELTLHVGAGTFQPIKEEQVQNHSMHSEQMVVHRENLEQLMVPDRSIIAVGTTSLRTLESLYWYGVLLSEDKEAVFQIPKLYPYQHDGRTLPTFTESVKLILEYMDRKGLETLVGETEIFIFPGYIFRVCQGLITNFHLPKSTLILLIAAFIGEQWREIYQHALDHDYRFLSYGDSSLLLPD